MRYRLIIVLYASKKCENDVNLGGLCDFYANISQFAQFQPCQVTWGFVIPQKVIHVCFLCFVFYVLCFLVLFACLFVCLFVLVLLVLFEQYYNYCIWWEGGYHLRAGHFGEPASS